MQDYYGLFFTIWLKFFFILTPFFIMSVFLSFTKNLDSHNRRITALKVTGNAILVAVVLFFFGKYVFQVFGITLDSFRIGAGILLFLTAVALVRGTRVIPEEEENDDFIMVPLTIPIIIGPATIGLIFVQSAQLTHSWEKVIGLSALIAALLCLGVVLFLSVQIERVVGKKGIVTMTKLTGLMLAAIAAQIIFTGIRNFLST
jgi:multiple antibiotic resistance protein